MLICNLWQIWMDSINDMHVLNTDVLSHRNKLLEMCLQTVYKEKKKKKYMESFLRQRRQPPPPPHFCLGEMPLLCEGKGYYLTHSHPPHKKMEKALLLDVRLHKQQGFHNPSQSNSPLYPGFMGDIAHDQCAMNRVRGRGWPPPLLIVKTRKRKIQRENVILLTPRCDREKVETFRVNYKKYGMQKITLMNDLIQVSYLHTQDTSWEQSGLTQLLPQILYHNFYNYLSSIVLKTTYSGFQQITH